MFDHAAADSASVSPNNTVHYGIFDCGHRINSGRHNLHHRFHNLIHDFKYRCRYCVNSLDHRWNNDWQSNHCGHNRDGGCTNRSSHWIENRHGLDDWQLVHGFVHDVFNRAQNA